MDNERRKKSKLELAEEFRDACLKSILERIAAASDKTISQLELFHAVAEDVIGTGVEYRYDAFESHISLLLENDCIDLTSMGLITLADIKSVA